MNRRARSTFALVATLLALAMQCFIPLAHAVHEAAHVAAAQAHHDRHHHHHGDEPDAPQDPHDESRCPTCQQLAMARAGALPEAPACLGSIELVNSDDAPACGGPLNGQVRRSPASPRGPPVV